MEEKSDHRQYEDIELRSEEVQEVMGEIPSWILQWGITILFIVLMAILITSYFFKYPDVISSEMTLEGRFPAATIVSRASGKIDSLYISDGEAVKAGMQLAVIENPANTEDIFQLKKLITKFTDNTDSLLIYTNSKKELVLGEVQNTYASFLNSIHEYQNYTSLNYYPRKIDAIKDQICIHDKYSANLRRQLRVIKDQYSISKKQYERDSLLYVRKVLSPFEFETASNTLLQSRYSLETASAALDNQSIQVSSLRASQLDLELQQAEKESQLIQNLQTSTGQLINAINSWQLNYCLTSPIEGKVTFTKYWNDRQYIPSGEKIFTIVPNEKDELVGKALLPVQRSGKVKIGQRVIVRFTNFPDQEFGVVNGKVQRISLVPTDANYIVEISFPDGLITNYNKSLPFSHEMTATAEIITEDLRLIERFIMPIKKILYEGVK